MSFSHLSFHSLTLAAPLAQLLTIHHLDVGQGDATLIRTETGSAALIDGGGRGKGIEVVLPFLRQHGITHLDAIAVSHYHADHIGGVQEILSGLSPDSVLSALDRGIGPPVPQSRLFSEYWSSAASLRVHVTVQPGHVIPLSRHVRLTCVAANGPVAASRGSAHGAIDENSRSMGWVLEYVNPVGRRRFVFRYFTGGDRDGESGSRAGSETPLADAVGRIDVLKVSHHGSRLSSSGRFLLRLAPRAAVISVGDGNKYGHPAQSTLDQLQHSPSVQHVYQTERGTGGLIPKAKVVGTVSVAVFDSFFVVAARDTFPMRTDEIRVPGGRPFAQSLVLYNLLGQEVLSFSVLSAHADASEVPAGVYFVRLSSPFHRKLRKIVVWP